MSDQTTPLTQTADVARSGVTDPESPSLGVRLIAGCVQGWLDYQSRERIREKLTTDDDTCVMCPPVWPNRGMLKFWVAELMRVADTLDRRGTAGDRREEFADGLTPVEAIAAMIAPELGSAIDSFLARPGGDAESERRRAAVKAILWDNKIGLLRVAQAYGPLTADVRETLKAALHHFGPDGVHKITSHVLAARRARENNEEIDKLEQII